jgi:peptidoglycan/xylan/chitin deacetylase (PgdA/CDA1 family)
MTISSLWKASLLSLDTHIAELRLRAKREEGVLLSFLFHSLFETQKEVQSPLMDPQQGITVEMFRECVGHFHACGYSFVSGDDVVRGLAPKGKYVLLTFDDGYYNNIRALPVLEEFGARATFFISTGYIKKHRSFWWDAVHREGNRRGVAEIETWRKCAEYKRRKTEDVERELVKEFGERTLQPVSDLDRPFTPSELRDFSKHPLVSFGNHTKDHAILSNYSESEAREQIRAAQDDLFEMTGHTPMLVAYPNGNESTAIRRIAQETGLQLGFGTRPGRNTLPLKTGPKNARTLKRFMLWGDRSVQQQCIVSRSGLSLYRTFQNAKVTIAARR